MNVVRTLLFGGAGGGSRAADLGLLALRLFAGLALAFGHGLGKWPPSARFVTGVGEMGFPIPPLFAWAAAVAELIGGAFLALGFLTRPAAFLILCTMAVAAFIRHANDPFAVAEKAMLFGAVALMYVLAGAGRYSIDALILRRRR